MDYHFTGSLSHRRINLGGTNASGSSSAQIAASARADRAVRHETRKRQSSALRLQARWRGYRCRSEVRRACAEEFWTQLHTDGARRDAQALLRLTRLMIWALQGSGHQADTQIIGAWAGVILQGDLLFVPFQSLETSIVQSWTTQLRLLLQPFINVLSEAAVPSPASTQRPSATAAASQVLLLLTSMTDLRGHAGRIKPLSGPFETLAQLWTQALIKAGLHRALASHLLLFPVDRKASSSLAPTVDLALAPFDVFPPLAERTTAGSIQKPIDVDAPDVGLAMDAALQARSQATETFVRYFLNVPNLPARIPVPALAKLVSRLPLTDVLDRVLQLGSWREANRAPERATSGRMNQRNGAPKDYGLEVLSQPHLLATIAALVSPRVDQLSTAPDLKLYLEAMSILQDALPRTFFLGALDETTSASATAADAHFVEAQIDEDEAAEKHFTTSRPDSATFKRLTAIVAPKHLQAVLTKSNKLSSTRPALTRFLLSTLLAWPTEARERVFATTMFGSPGGSGGLVRELWRGWVRSSQLARTLASADSKGDGPRAALSTLENAGYRSDWYPFILLVEIYSRTLLTLGDDEFYPAERHTEFAPPIGAASGSTPASSSRNPLSLDDVVSFSALVRNLTFALYWLEGAPGSGGACLDLPLRGLRMLRSELRSILTAALRQIHARDARRQFAPDGHWLMTSSMDLNSFLETVLLEEDELGASSSSTHRPGADESNDEDDMDTASDGLLVEGHAHEQQDEVDQRGVSSRVRAGRGKNNNLTARQMAFLSPRLGILNNIPFVIHFDLRVKIFRQFIRKDRRRIGLDNRVHRINAYHKVKVRRGFVAEDGFSQLNHLGPAIKGDVEIQFLDEFGQLEAGIDGGGLFKEFLTSLVKEAFDTDRGLWLATEQQELYPNPHSYARQPEQLEWYAFLGRVLGKAMYEGILVDIKFARFFLSKWLGKQGYFDDLASLDSLDPNLYKGLMYLKNYTGDVESDLALNFTVQDDELGVVKSTELVPGGSNIPVTKENRLSYIYRMSRYRLTGQIAWQCDAFFRGLSDIIDTRWLRILDVDELRVLVCGTEEPIDVDDLRRNTVIHNYHEKDDAVTFFWQALESFSPDERRSFLKLSPKLGIQKSSDDTSRLPTAATCMNLLKLPNYTSFEQCRSKLLYAIKSGAGFDLS